MTRLSQAEASVRIGFGVLGYEWMYVPLCKHVFGVAPWGLTIYAFAMFGLAAVCWVCSKAFCAD